MKVLVMRTIHYYMERYPLAEKALSAWVNEFTQHDYVSFNELKQVFGNASIIRNSRIIFNIKGNDFRLIVSLNLEQRAAYVIWFGTHAEYDRIDAETITYDTSINNFKKR